MQSLEFSRNFLIDVHEKKLSMFGELLFFISEHTIEDADNYFLSNCSTAIELCCVTPLYALFFTEQSKPGTILTLQVL
jgi:hypothetical protein